MISKALTTILVYNLTVFHFRNIGRLYPGAKRGLSTFAELDRKESAKKARVEAAPPAFLLAELGNGSRV